MDGWMEGIVCPTAARFSLFNSTPPWPFIYFNDSMSFFKRGKRAIKFKRCSTCQTKRLNGALLISGGSGGTAHH